MSSATTSSTRSASSSHRRVPVSRPRARCRTHDVGCRRRQVDRRAPRRAIVGVSPVPAGARHHAKPLAWRQTASLNASRREFVDHARRSRRVDARRPYPRRARARSPHRSRPGRHRAAGTSAPAAPARARWVARNVQPAPPREAWTAITSARRSKRCGPVRKRPTCSTNASRSSGQTKNPSAPASIAARSAATDSRDATVRHGAPSACGGGQPRLRDHEVGLELPSRFCHLSWVGGGRNHSAPRRFGRAHARSRRTRPVRRSRAPRVVGCCMLVPLASRRRETSRDAVARHGEERGGCRGGVARDRTNGSGRYHRRC